MYTIQSCNTTLRFALHSLSPSDQERQKAGPKSGHGKGQAGDRVKVQQLRVQIDGRQRAWPKLQWKSTVSSVCMYVCTYVPLIPEVMTTDWKRSIPGLIAMDASKQLQYSTWRELIHTVHTYIHTYTMETFIPRDTPSRYAIWIENGAYSDSNRA